jgi:hypothetical protein
MNNCPNKLGENRGNTDREERTIKFASTPSFNSCVHITLQSHHDIHKKFMLPIYTGCIGRAYKAKDARTEWRPPRRHTSSATKKKADRNVPDLPTGPAPSALSVESSSAAAMGEPWLSASSRTHLPFCPVNECVLRPPPSGDLLGPLPPGESPANPLPRMDLPFSA